MWHCNFTKGTRKYRLILVVSVQNSKKLQSQCNQSISMLIYEQISIFFISLHHQIVRLRHTEKIGEFHAGLSGPARLVDIPGQMKQEDGLKKSTCAFAKRRFDKWSPTIAWHVNIWMILNYYQCKKKNKSGGSYKTFAVWLIYLVLQCDEISILF